MAARGWFCYPQHPGEPHHPGNLQHPARTPRSSESGYTSSQNTYANDRVCYVDVGFPGGGEAHLVGAPPPPSSTSITAAPDAPNQQTSS